jgi:hypothetical protein
VQAVFSDHNFHSAAIVPFETTKLIRQLGSVPSAIVHPLQQGYTKLVSLQNRQRAELLEEITEIRGFMPLLMKQRNGIHWTHKDRRLIMKQMRSLARLSPYAAALLLPGGLLVLPLMAWWLDRRRLKRGTDATAADSEQP